MNGRQRILSALSREVPDRVPHFELAYNESSILKIAGCFTEDLPQPDYIQRMSLESRVKLFDAVLLVVEELDVDGLTLRIFPETRAIDNEHYVDDWGVTFLLSPHGEPLVVGGPIRDENDLASYEPPKIKESVSGYGNASKQQVQFMVQSILELDELPKPDDAADGLAVALTHYQYQQHEMLYGD